MEIFGENAAPLEMEVWRFWVSQPYTIFMDYTRKQKAIYAIFFKEKITAHKDSF